jgi:4-diphosphocytidyl-2-C-methyl-D-erythritol kinase
VIERAPGKVNLCLYLGPARTDGRHELVTVLESVSLFDELTLTVLGGGEDQVICAGVAGPNLVADALRMLRERGWQGPPVLIEIVKRIPVAGGMAGGSADAAAALRLASRVCAVPAETVAELARALGSDVPAMLVGGVSLGTGGGELVEPLAPVAGHTLAILPLGEPLSTAEVYGEADRLGLGRSADQLTAAAAALRAGAAPDLTNDLEAAARSLCPAIDGALDALRDAGASEAFVSGSGPTCAGLWWGAGAAEQAGHAVSALVGRFPGATAVTPVPAIGHNSPSLR